MSAQTAGCVDPLYVETISTRQPERPRFAAALAALRPNDILTVTMLDRLGRNTLELITSAQDIEHRGNRLEILQGPLVGIYDPRGAGKIVFAASAATEIEPVTELDSGGALRLPRARVVPLSVPPASYTAVVERYLTGTGIAKSSVRIYRISLTTWGWMLTGEPAPTGPSRRGAKPPVFPAPVATRWCPWPATDKRRAPVAGGSRTTAVHGITTSLQKSPTRSV